MFKRIPHLGTAVEKARDAKYKAIAGFENRKADDDRNCLTR